MDITFWHFAKRVNSTLIPADRQGIDGTTISAVFKDGADAIQPTMELRGDSFKTYWNYAYIPFLSRYYFVRATRSVAYSVYEVDLYVDVLGTYRSQIYGQSLFAMMSTSFYETELDDTRVVPTADFDRKTEYGEFEIISGVTPTAFPCYQFLSVVNNSGKLNGIDVFFGLNLISDYLRKVTDRNWAQQFATDVQGINPFDAVNAAWWSPLIPQQCHTVSTNTAQIYDVAISASCLDSPDVKKHEGTISVPKPSVSDFRYSDKYVKYYLDIPYVGVIDVPTELARQVNTMSYAYAGDCLTGQIVIAPTIYGVNLGVFSTSLRSDIQLARQSGKGAQVVMSTVLGGAAGALGGAKLAGAEGAIIGGVAGLASGSIKGVSAVPNIDRTTGMSGSIALAGCRDHIGSVRLVMVESASNINPSTFAATAGRPTQKIITLAAGIGYVQTVNASIAVAATQQEMELLNSMLNGGAYFE